MILVTGATGTIGTEVVRQLAAAGQKVRALVRSPEKAEKLKGPNVELARGAFEDVESLRKALQGVDKLFLLSSGPEHIEQSEPRVVDEAKKAGVKHVVKLSVIGAEYEPGIELGRLHRAVEKKIEGSGMAWTFLRPGAFMSNMLNNVGTIKAQGKFYGAYADGKLAVIDPKDIAAVAVKALTSSGHEGKAYALTGLEPLSQAQLAEKMSKAMGKPVEYVNVPPEAAKDSMLKMGVPNRLANMLVEFSGVVRSGMAAAVAQDVEKVLGRKPRTFDDWAKENAAAFQ
jgi:uncharacterized protein YbjT (DUF2867 family)